MTVTIQLFGPLRVSACDGSDLTPRSAKARGMIALLATSSTCRRSRSWLQSRLWSDRGREQAAASLRQVLTETRKALGASAHLLVTDRMDVSLDRAAVSIAAERAPSEDREFLEGIDVRDVVFDDWLRRERRKLGRDAPQGAPVSSTIERTTPTVSKVFLVNETPVSEGMERFFSDHFADSIARSLSEILNVTLSYGPDVKLDRTGVVVRTSATLSSGLAGLRVAMERGDPGELIWSGSELVHSRGLPPVEHENVLRLINNAAEGIVDAIYGQKSGLGQRVNVQILVREALNKLFSMERSEHVQADRLLQMAYELDPRGVFLAWRAMLRMLMLVERHEGVEGEPELEAIDFARRGFELEPMNSMVLAAAANAALILEAEVEKGQELAERAMRINPANPFAVDAASIAAMYLGDVERAHTLQLRAKHISGNTQFSHWFDMGCAMTASLNGDLQTALTMAKRASAMSPAFRPPLRYLVALYMRAGDVEKAHDMVIKLREIEPKFQIEQLWDDDRYPVRDLRRNTDLVKAVRTL